MFCFLTQHVFSSVRYLYRLCCCVLEERVSLEIGWVIGLVVGQIYGFTSKYSGGKSNGKCHPLGTWGNNQKHHGRNPKSGNTGKEKTQPSRKVVILIIELTIMLLQSKSRVRHLILLLHVLLSSMIELVQFCFIWGTLIFISLEDLPLEQTWFMKYLTLIFLCILQLVALWQ